MALGVLHNSAPYLFEILKSTIKYNNRERYLDEVGNVYDNS